MRLCAVRLRERRGCEGNGCGPGCGEAEGLTGAALGLVIGLGAGCSGGNSNCVGETLVPRLPFWLDVVTESEEVAVVVPLGLSILTMRGQSHVCVSWKSPGQDDLWQHDAPSGSEPAAEALPLQL